MKRVTIGRIVQEWTGDDGARDELMAYVQVKASLDGRPITLGTMLGVREHEHGTCRASGAGVRPFLRTWWADASDWQDVPRERLAAVAEAILRAAPRLWRELCDLREQADQENGPRVRYTLHTIDGEDVSLTLPEFLATCGEIPPELVDEIRLLAPGETLHEGGGAAPPWSITREVTP